VGSIGDYPPRASVSDIGPTNWAQITNFLGVGVSTDAVYKANFDAYYQLLMTRFLENTQQLYGFDRFTDPDLFYKSVETGRTDTAFTYITPTDFFNQVYFVSTNPNAVAVTPTQASSFTQTVSVTGINQGESQIQANGGNTNGPRTGKLEVSCFHKATKSLAVRVIHEQNDDVQVISPGTTGLVSTAVVVSCGPNGFRDTVPTAGDTISADGLSILAGPDGVANTTANSSNVNSPSVTLADVLTYLNSIVYNQAVFEWSVTVLPDMAVNFDTNRDARLELLPWMNGEMQLVANACHNSSYDNNVYIVGDSSTAGVMGIMEFAQSDGFVFGNVTPHIPTTIAHELGHGAFSLTHPGGLGVPVNIMTQGSQRKWRLFRDQWFMINP
jgi:hypothetical protein